MIKREFSPSAVDGYFAANPVSCVALEALTYTYGLENNVFELYVQLINENITAVIGKYGDAARISAAQNADTDEIKEFISFLSPKTVTAFRSEIRDIGEAYEPHHADLLVMKDFKPRYLDVVFYPDLSDVHALVSRYLPMRDEASFTAEMQTRINHDSALTAAIYDNEKIASTASVFFISRACGFIGGVATDEKYRGRGYASALVSALCEKLISRNKTPLIACIDESAKRIYTSLGFIKTDERVTFKPKE